jgi:hypothetical protein
MTESISVPPPYEDRDCHRPARLEDYTRGWMVKQRVIGASSQRTATCISRDVAMVVVGYCLGLETANGDRKYIEVSLWHDGRPVEIWQNGKPMMAKAVAS